MILRSSCGVSLSGQDNSSVLRSYTIEASLEGNISSNILSKRLTSNNCGEFLTMPAALSPFRGLTMLSREEVLYSRVFAYLRKCLGAGAGIDFGGWIPGTVNVGVLRYPEDLSTLCVISHVVPRASESVVSLFASVFDFVPAIEHFSKSV